MNINDISTGTTIKRIFWSMGYFLEDNTPKGFPPARQA